MICLALVFAELRWWNYVPQEWFFLLIYAIILVVYLIPTLIAGLNRHPQFIGIAVVNTAFGWSGIGYLLCLIWAFRKPDPVVVVPQAARVSSPPPPHLPKRPQLEEELAVLESLRERRLVSDEEYAIRRRRLLETVS